MLFSNMEVSEIVILTEFFYIDVNKTKYSIMHIKITDYMPEVNTEVANSNRNFGRLNVS